MASIRLIRRRIKSTKNIAQITRAMEMVAASKMKKAQEAALSGKAYADKIYEATRELVKRTEKKAHPLLSLGNPSGKILVVVVSTTKGLCGGLNTNLFRELIQWFPKETKTDFITIGKKGESFVAGSGRTLIADFSQTQPFYESVAAVTDLIVNGFLDGTYREVYVLFNSFINAMKQLPTKKLLLPLTVMPQEEKLENAQEFAQFLIEPDMDDVLENLLPHYLENQLRAAINEGEASEHSARMIAMKNATEAAMDFIEALTMLYNKARQEKITYEIADMVTARMAFE